MDKYKAQIAIAVICLILGFSITLQLKSVRINYQGQPVQTMRNAELLRELNSEKEKNEALYQQIILLNDDLSMYRQESSDSSGYAKVLSEQLDRAELLSGAVAVTGSGVVVTLDDSKVKVETNSAIEAEQYIIHDDDLREVVNELSGAGAEAISINEERLVATSAIRCVGSVILVNNTKYAPPYTIKAIGNPETLEAALNMRNGVVDVLRNIYQIGISIEKKTGVVVPGYSGAVTFKYASPYKKEGGD